MIEDHVCEYCGATFRMDTSMKVAFCTSCGAKILNERVYDPDAIVAALVRRARDCIDDYDLEEARKCVEEANQTDPSYRDIACLEYVLALNPMQQKKARTRMDNATKSLNLFTEQDIPAYAKKAKDKMNEPLVIGLFFVIILITAVLAVVGGVLFHLDFLYIIPVLLIVFYVVDRLKDRKKRKERQAGRE